MPTALLDPATGRAGIAARALALTALSCLLAALALTLAAREPRAQPVAMRTSAPLPPASDLDLERQVERHALNALLVPVLDDEAGTPAWADPSTLLACGPATTVLVDHHPLQPGTPQNGRAFTLTWTLDHCTPFGPDGPMLTGRAELDVFRDDNGLSAIVRPQDLQVERQGRLAWMTHTFTARMP